MKIVLFITLNVMAVNYTSTTMVKQAVDNKIHTEHIKAITNQSHSNNIDHLIDKNHWYSFQCSDTRTCHVFTYVILI